MSNEMQGAKRTPSVHRLAAMATIGGRTGVTLLVLLAGVVIAAAAGYWFGQRSGQEQAAAAPAGDEGRKILYYRNPMGMPSTSPTPKQDSMGMDYIPVFEGEDDAGGGIRISAERVQKLGVRVVPVERRALDEMVRASGRIEADERRLATVTAKFDGFIEKLHVNATGRRWVAARRCSMPSAPSSWPRNASTRWQRRAWPSSTRPMPRRVRACSGWRRLRWRGCGCGM